MLGPSLFYYGENPKAHGVVFLKQIIHCFLHHPNFSNERLILLNKLLSIDKSFLSKCNSGISKVRKYLMMQKNTSYNYINSISTSIQQIFVMLHYIILETKLSFSVVYLKFLFTYIQVFLVCLFHLEFFAFSILTIVSSEYFAKRLSLAFSFVYLFSIYLKKSTLGLK